MTPDRAGLLVQFMKLSCQIAGGMAANTGAPYYREFTDSRSGGSSGLRWERGLTGYKEEAHHGHSLFICDSAYDDTESVGVCSGINNQKRLLNEVINYSLIEIGPRAASKCLFLLSSHF